MSSRDWRNPAVEADINACAVRKAGQNTYIHIYIGTYTKSDFVWKASNEAPA
jgi:hypothetical protein